jgi:glycosyltransferase involved in cell wall biosynthesis
MRISVVICTYNRVKFIKACLEHLNAQQLAKSDYEVIVVNNNCTDGTGKVVEAFIAQHPGMDIRQVFETNQGLSFARNRGIREAKYEIITYIDDDGEAKPDLLQKIKTYFETNPEKVGVGGKVIPQYETEAPKWLSYHTRMMVTHIDYGDEHFKCYGKKYPPGCNMSYRKDILEQTNGFNESLKWRVDDKHIYYEVCKISDEVYINPELVVHHNIDAYRVSDESFDILSKRLGEEEKLRTKDLGGFTYLLKVFEYLAIFGASLLFWVSFALKGESIKGKYLARFRWLAFKGLIAKK